MSARNVFSLLSPLGAVAALSSRPFLLKFSLAMMMALVVSGCAHKGMHHAEAPAPTVPDHFIAQGQKSEVAIATDRIAVFLREGAQERARELFAALGLRELRQYHGVLHILRTAEPMERQALMALAREVKQKGEGVVAQAGLVVTQRADDEAPMLLSDEVIVGFSPQLSRKEIEAIITAQGARIVMANPFVKNQFLLAADPDKAMDGLMAARRFLEAAEVDYAYPNFISIFIDLETIPNDTLFGNQWHLRNTGQSGGTVDADNDASVAWDITQGAANTLIAVIENGGFDMAHPDLTPNLWTNAAEIPGNGLDDDGNGFTDDVNGWDFAGCASPAVAGCGDNNQSPADATENHGTAVAGVAAARGNNNLGVSGACPNCTVMPLRTGYVSSDWAKSLAFGYAQTAGAPIITNSWGGGGATPNTITAINNAAAAGVTIFFAAGNTTNDVCAGVTQDPRVSSGNVIAVSSASNQDRKVVWAAVGNCIDILAPSHRGYDPADPYTGTLNVTTTDRTGANGYNNNSPVANCPTVEAAPPPANARDYTACFGGTSSASPLAAGTAGLMLTANNGLTRVQLQRLLQDTTDKVEDSAGSYATSNGFSNPAAGTPTHAFGRINAFEAVRVVAPVAQGGKGGVDIFVRDNRLDWGNTEQPSNTLFEATRGYIGHWRSEDIKVDAPPYAAAPTAATFDSFVDETPSAAPGAINRVYVRVRNRGPVTADLVNVKLHWTQFGTALPALPADFWTAFPANSTDTSQWHPLNCGGTASSVCAINNLAYSGSSVAGTATDVAQIVQFDFPAPPIDPLLANHFCLMAIADSSQDPVSAASKASAVVDFITPTDNNVTHRNYMNLSTDAADEFMERFFVRNPTREPMRARLRLEAPERWKVDLDHFGFGQPFYLEPGQEVLVTAALSLPGVGERGEITIVQDRFDGKSFVPLGAVTFGLAPKAPAIETPGGASAYLVGTYDQRKSAQTLLQVVNPSAKHLRVVAAFFDDNEKPLRCVREKMSPNDLWEIDVKKLELKAPVGVVKLLALNERDNRPEVGIVANQRLTDRGEPVAETGLHPIQSSLIEAEMGRILSACH